MENREQVVNTLISRVIENAPLRELIRVYSEAVKAAVDNLSDDDVVRSIAAAGYTDILEAFSLEVPAAAEAPAEEPVAVWFISAMSLTNLQQRLVDILVEEEELMARLPILPWDEDTWFEIVFMVGNHIHNNPDVIEDMNRLRDWFDSYRFALENERSMGNGRRPGSR